MKNLIQIYPQGNDVLIVWVWKVCFYYNWDKRVYKYPHLSVSWNPG